MKNLIFLITMLLFNYPREGKNMFTYARAYNFNNHRVLGFWATKTSCQDLEQMILMGQAVSFYDHKTNKQIIIPAAACANLFFEISDK